jgi:putative PIN family toxin of toxin-antitoxin system
VRVVFDTNVLIAAFLTEGVCSKLLLRARKRECDLILSKAIVAEFEEVLAKKFSVSSSDLSNVRSLVKEAAGEILQEVNPIQPFCRDPNDDKILSCAKEAKADYLVTGDQDLLVLSRFEDIPIITPRDFEALFSD